MPVYDSVAFEHETAENMQAAFEGRLPSHSYSRISNPTVEDYEQRVRLLTDALGVIAVSSGMAAISNVILALAEAGTNIVTTRSLFGNTYSLFESTLRPWGLDISYVDLSNPDAIAAAIDENTRAVFLETITNPQLQVIDVEAVAKVAHAHNVPVIVDGTVTSPYLFRAKDFGADLEVMASTKYISGGATSVGGLIIDYGTFNWRRNPKIAPWVAKFGANALLTVDARRRVPQPRSLSLAPQCLPADAGTRNPEPSRAEELRKRAGRCAIPGAWTRESSHRELSGIAEFPIPRDRQATISAWLRRHSDFHPGQQGGMLCLHGQLAAHPAGNQY